MDRPGENINIELQLKYMKQTNLLTYLWSKIIIREQSAKINRGMED